MSFYWEHSPPLLPGAWAGLAVKEKQQLMNNSVNEGLIRRGKCVTECETSSKFLHKRFVKHS